MTAPGQAAGAGVGPGQGHVQDCGSRLGCSRVQRQSRGAGLQGRPGSVSTAGSTGLSPQLPRTQGTDQSPGPEDQQRELERGQVT